MLRKLDSQVRYSYKTKSSSYKLPESIKNKDLNVRSRSTEKKNINEGSNLGHCNRQEFFFLEKKIKARKIKVTINKWYYIKLKSLWKKGNNQ